MKEETREPDKPVFHYNREERMASLPEDTGERRRRGIFRGNRSLLITLIDVVFLVVLVAVFSVVSRMMGDATLIRGYSVTARAMLFDDRVLVSVKISSREDTEVPEAIRIRFGYPAGDERVEISDFLPEGKKEERIYRGALERDARYSKVVIDFVTDDERASMTANIRAE